MAARVQLNNFRFSIYIDADGTVTVTDLPPELREVAQALDPTHVWGASSASQEASTVLATRQAMSDDLAQETAGPDSCRRMA